MWSYLIHLSAHMWDDEFSVPEGLYLKNGYRETNGTDLEIWDDTIKFLAECKYTHVLIDVGDALKYERHPEISAPDAWDKDFLKKKLDEIRALGMTPIPKLNFSTCHDTWLKKYRRMISTPEYYEACTDCIREVSEVFGSPEYFHLGFDEEFPDYQIACQYDTCTVRGEHLWWHDLNLFVKECEKWGSRAWVWSDYYWHHKDIFIKRMSKEILQSNWFYGNIKNYTEEEKKGYFALNAVDAYSELSELGFDQVPTSSTWESTWNTYQTVCLGHERITSGLYGFMTAPWKFTCARDKFVLKDDAYRLYLARKEIYPETL